MLAMRRVQDKDAYITTCGSYYSILSLDTVMLN